MASLRKAAFAQVRALAEGAREEGLKRRIVWAVIAMLLVLVPVVFNLARTSRFTASIEIFPDVVPPYEARHDRGYWRSMLSDAQLHKEMIYNANASLEKYRDATFRATARRTLLVAVDSGDPAEAQRLVNALGPQLVGASARQLASQAADEAAVLRARVRRQRMRPVQRRALERRLRRLERLHAAPVGRAVLGPRAPEPRLERWTDRVADAMPGGFPDRPSPLWTGLSGLLLVLTLWAIALALVPPARAQRQTVRRA